MGNPNTALSILIVDDNAELRTILGEILERLGHTVLSTDKAKDALSLIERGDVNLCLLDLKMPGVTGFELLKVIRRRRLPIPVIVVSAHISQDAAKELTEIGVQGMVAKPFKKERIAEEIQRVAKRNLGIT